MKPRSEMRGATSGSPEAHGAPQRVGDERLVVGDRGAHGNPGALVHVRRAAREAGDLGDDLLHVARDPQLAPGRADVDALLGDDVQFLVDVARVVRADVRAVAVLERGDDAAAVGVVLRVGRRHDEDVEVQAHLVAADLDVALLHHVEQADLDAFGQVRQLVDREDAAVGARDQAVVDGQLVAEVAALGDLDRVHLADQVGDGDVWRGELLAVALVAVPSSGSARRHRAPR